MKTSPHRTISGSLKKLCFYLLLVFALGFAALACSSDPPITPTLTDQPQQTSTDQSTPDPNSLSTDCGPSSPCYGGGSDNSDTTAAQESGNAASPQQSCQPADPNQPFCVFLDSSQLSSSNQVTLSWQPSDSSSSYQYNTTLLSFPSGTITNQSITVSGDNASLDQTININSNELYVMQVDGCTDTCNGSESCIDDPNCYGSEPIIIDTGYSPQASSNAQTQQAVMLRASSQQNFSSSSLKFGQNAPCANFCAESGNLLRATYYISRPTVSKISQVLRAYKVAKDFIQILQAVLPDLLASLECTPCAIASTVLTIIATILGFYIDAFQKVLNANSKAQGVTFSVQWGIFLERESIQPVG